ncbi:thermonuclease family protein [Lentisalinibacter orientalis]|uniref:thermonuclease family protein n=1 Tax=Lentisalinibacter orientalis TaxID=2992241 RepID=UPI003868A803
MAILMRTTAALLLCLLPLLVSAAELSGRVVGIADGDTFTLLTVEREQVKIRLAEIDAPERGQPYGNRARQVLSELVFQKAVRVEVQTTDRYGRTVGRPYVGELDVCAEMVRRGAAWVYRRYLRDRSLLAHEEAAREAERGLWGLSEARNVPPWEWRRSGNQESAPSGCNIKGNIGKGGARIYHVPGSSSYGPTRIDESKGERWFCSEEEARAAGWRAPR